MIHIVLTHMSYLKDGGSDEKIYIFGKDGAKKLALEQNINFLGEIPIISGISDLVKDQNEQSNLDLNKICDIIVSNINNHNI